MKKIFTALSALCFVIVLSAQSKYYYAFNEKIPLTLIPNRFAVKFKTPENSTKALTQVQKLSSQSKYLNETTISMTSESGMPGLLSTLNSNEIEVIKPAYKVGELEMFYTTQILVETKSGYTIQYVLDKVGLTKNVVVKVGKFWDVLEISPSYDACDIANKIQESGLVVYSHPNFIAKITPHQTIPTDPYFNNQYYLRNTGQIFNPIENHAGTPNADINASWAWNSSTGNNAIVVAVLDQGVTSNHPDLPNARQVRLNGSNFCPGQNANDPSPTGDDNHGNSCAGIIAATHNNEGIAGIAPLVRIMPVKILSTSSSADVNGVAAALDFAWQNGADVISNSWGYQGQTNPNLYPAIVSAINRAATQGRGGRGCVVAISASNTASHIVGVDGVVSFPSNVNINGVLTVGASDRNNVQADYSPTSVIGGTNNQIIDIVAPSHRAYPPISYAPGIGGINGETFEIWSIDLGGNAGYNTWKGGQGIATGETLPAAGVNNLFYTGRFGGTSAACPQVAAVAALILSMNTDLYQTAVFNILTQSAEKVGGYVYTNGWSTQLGFGKLNACAALNAIPNRFVINGASVVCTTTSNYSITGLPVGSTVTWSTSNSLVATISPTGVLSKVNIGVVNVSAAIVIPNRCGVASATTSVTVGIPTISSSSIVAQRFGTSCYYDAAVTLSAPGTTVDFSFNNVTWFAGIQNGNIFRSGNGDFVGPMYKMVYARTKNTCGTSAVVSKNLNIPGPPSGCLMRQSSPVSSTDTLPISTTTTDVVSENIVIYPNPTTNKLIITIPQTSNKTLISIYDGNGKLVHSGRLNNQANELNISSYAAGLYLIKVSIDGVVTKNVKIIKQ